MCENISAYKFHLEYVIYVILYYIKLIKASRDIFVYRY